MELTPITLKPQAKSPLQVLEEWCAKSGLGTQIFQLHSTVSRDNNSGKQIHLFLFKVTISALMNPQPSTPSKLSRYPVEAKVIAAELTLAKLGVPMECWMIS